MQDLETGMSMDAPSGPNRIASVLRGGEPFSVVVGEQFSEGKAFQRCHLADFEEGTTRRGMEAASRSWKRQQNVFSLKAAERKAGLLTLWL